MAITGTKLSQVQTKVEQIQGTERIYVSDNGTQKYIETSQLATSKQLEEKASKDEIPDVSGFITSTQADGRYQPKGNYATTEQLLSKADKIEVVSVEGATPSQEIQSNKLYKFGECTSLTVTLAEEVEGVLNEYMFEFVSGATATTLNLPETVKWVGESIIETSKTYQVSIVNNIAVMGGA